MSRPGLWSTQPFNPVILDYLSPGINSAELEVHSSPLNDTEVRKDELPLLLTPLWHSLHYVQRQSYLLLGYSFKSLSVPDWI